MAAISSIWRARRGVVSVAVALVLGSGLLVGCGATLNPGLEQGIPTGEHATLGNAASASSADAATPVGFSATGSEAAVSKTSVKLPSGVESFASASTPGSSAYKIGPLDVLEVTVFKVAELNRVVQVGEAGTVNLPLVNEMMAAGKTPQQFERELTKRLGDKYLQSPQVSVNVREFNSQRVTVEGAVKAPGVYPIKGRTTLLQVTALAGGLNTDVATNEIVVFRTRESKRYAAKFDVSAIRTGNAEDPVLVSGDVVVVNTSEIKNGFNNFLKALPLASFLLLL